MWPRLLVTTEDDGNIITYMYFNGAYSMQWLTFSHCYTIFSVNFKLSLNIKKNSYYASPQLYNNNNHHQVYSRTDQNKLMKKNKCVCCVIIKLYIRRTLGKIILYWVQKRTQDFVLEGAENCFGKRFEGWKLFVKGVGIIKYSQKITFKILSSKLEINWLIII